MQAHRGSIVLGNDPRCKLPTLHFGPGVRRLAPFAAVLGMALVCSSLAGEQQSSPKDATTSGQAATVPLDVGNQRQLFLDHRFFADAHNITLRMNSPTKMGPILLPDKPWETMDMGFCVSVVQDGDLYKIWYLSQCQEGQEGYRLCYACSKDGIVWEKPNLGLIEYNGSSNNNIVMAGIVETTVFLDPVAPPESRYKAVAMMHWPAPDRAGLYIHTSPDGIHWTMSDSRVFPVAVDTANQAFYDTRLKKYVANIRVWAPQRKIGRVEMDDITKPWPLARLEKPFYIWGADKIPVASYEVPIVFGYDEHDPPNSDHYSPACVQYPWADQAYLMFPSPYRHFPEPPIGRFGNDGLVDIQMAVSRDGVAWTRLSREPYVALGTDEEVDSRQMYMAVGMVRRGNTIFQYYGGSRTSHGQLPIQPGSICRLQQRLDGFVSADAPLEGGEFTTPPLVFSGKQLVLNINASALGICTVEILDEQGRVLPGFSRATCEEVDGNHVEKAVSWRGQTDLSALSGQAVRLHFVLRACKLFAFQFR